RFYRSSNSSQTIRFRFANKDIWIHCISVPKCVKIAVTLWRISWQLSSRARLKRWLVSVSVSKYCQKGVCHALKVRHSAFLISASLHEVLLDDSQMVYHPVSIR